MGSSWKHGFQYEVEEAEAAAAAAEKEEADLRELAGESVVDNSQHMRAEIQHMREHATVIKRDKKTLLADLNKHIENLERLQTKGGLNDSQSKRLRNKLTVMIAARADVESNGQTNHLAEAVANSDNSDYKKGIFSKTERLVNQAVSFYQRAKQSPVDSSWSQVASIFNEQRAELQKLPKLREELEQWKGELEQLKELATSQGNKIEALSRNRHRITRTPDMQALKDQIKGLKAQNASIIEYSNTLLRQKKISRSQQSQRTTNDAQFYSNNEQIATLEEQYQTERMKLIAAKQPQSEQMALKYQDEHRATQQGIMTLSSKIDTQSKQIQTLQKLKKHPLIAESQALVKLKSTITKLETKESTLLGKITALETEESRAEPDTKGKIQEKLASARNRLANTQYLLASNKNHLNINTTRFLSKHSGFGAQQHTLEKEILKHLVAVSGKNSDKSIDKTAVLHAALACVRMPTDKNYAALEKAKEKHPDFNAAAFFRKSTTGDLVNQAINFKDVATTAEEAADRDFLSSPKHS